MTAIANKANLAARVHKMEAVAATPEERSKVVAFDRAVRQALRSPAPRGACCLVDAEGNSTEMPEAVFQFVVRIAEVLAKGDAITLVPVGKLLTTQQAADILNVSRQHLVDLLAKDEIRHQMVGRHRRIKIEDLLGYKALRDERRREGLREMVAMSEKMGLYDEAHREDEVSVTLTSGAAPSKRTK